MPQNLFSTAVFMAIISAVSLTVSCGGIGQQKAGSTSGIITFSVGKAEIIRSGAASPAKMMSAVNQGDILSTGPGSSITVQIGSDRVVKIQPETKVTFASLSSEKGDQLNLEKGQVLAKVEKIKKNNSFRIKTPTTIAAVRGTEFSASYINGESTVAVKTGKVAVAAKTSSPAAEADSADQMLKDAVVVETGKTAVLAAVEPSEATKQAPEKIEIREITKAESLTVEKIAIVPLIAEPEKKTESEFIKIQEPVNVQDKKLEEQIAPEYQQDKIKTLSKKKQLTLDEIRKVYNRIDEITLYNKKVIQGAIISRGAAYQVLTTGGSITIQAKEIKSVRVVQ